jgi:hypothetical protein
MRYADSAKKLAGYRREIAALHRTTIATGQRARQPSLTTTSRLRPRR